MAELSILIPARNELWLANTVADVLAHSEADTEVIVILDGAPALTPLPAGPRVRVVELAQSIGQRAATNMAARMSDAKYVMKLDAHCSLGQGFDRILIEDMRDDYICVPAMRNLWAFSWQCDSCGCSRYQGPPGPCHKCGSETRMDVKWVSKPNPQSTSYRFSTDLIFQYWREYKKRAKREGNLTETMSLQGSCFILTRERYFALDICDEAFGSWGQQGTEVALKGWLSGGRVMVNHGTYYSHLFRTQGPGFGFPYPLSGAQVNHARDYCRDLFLNNKWPKQIYPLSWLVERFWPVPGWEESDLARIREFGKAFCCAAPSLVLSLTDIASAESLGHLGGPSGLQEMPTGTMGLSAVDRREGVGSAQVVDLQNQSQVKGITAGLVVADMVQNGDTNSIPHRNGADKPSIHQPMDTEHSAMAECFPECHQADLPITVGVASACPDPALAQRVIGVDLYSGEQAVNSICVKGGNCEILTVSHSMPPTQVSNRSETGQAATCSVSLSIPQIPPVTKSIVYYTDNRLPPGIMAGVQRQLAKSGLDVVSVSLAPIDFGRNIVVDGERGVLTMFRQILAGLEASTADVIYLAEHDVLYDPSHFAFTPPDRTKVWYNLAVWDVRYPDGHALFHEAKRTSQLCAYRDVLVEHYRRRVALVERDGFTRKQGFEPGSHGRPERVDDLQSDVWRSVVPNIDIKHGGNLTQARWRKDQFRNQRYTQVWIEADEVPGWGKTEQVMHGLSD